MRNAAIGALIGFAAAWFVQGLRWDNHVAGLKLDSNAATIALFSEFGQNFTDALQSAAHQRGLNEKSQQELADTLRSLRADVNRVRGDVADMPGRVQNASAAALAEYATACAAVHADLVESGERLAGSGAEIATKAQGHALDASTAVNAWPRAD